MIDLLGTPKDQSQMSRFSHCIKCDDVPNGNTVPLQCLYVFCFAYENWSDLHASASAARARTPPAIVGPSTLYALYFAAVTSNFHLAIAIEECGLLITANKIA